MANETCSSSATADLRENNRRPHEISSVLLPICISTMTVRFSNVVIDLYCAGDKIEKNEMGWACGTYG